ncbi:MAG: monovalent cation/H(+) antiporter subunit G [Chloroflexota bacterium]|nr:monovalent cation/H(+) antiporter subunit G [Chloroflexota bacterium]
MILDVISDILVVVGLVFMTLGVFGMIRMPDIYTKLHAASKAVFLGVIVLAIAAMFVGSQAMIMRLILLSAMLLVTTPVAAHAIGRGAYITGEEMGTPGAVDESGAQLPEENLRTPSWRL